MAALSTPFGPIYEDVPLDTHLGYPAGTVIRIRVNPTKGQWGAWLEAMTVPADETEPERRSREKRLCVALCYLYGAASLPGFTFATPAAAEGTWAREDVPDELWTMLLHLPWSVIAARREAILKNALRSSPARDFTAISPTATE